MRLCWIENEGAWRDSGFEKLSALGFKIYTLEKNWYSDSLENLVERIMDEFSATDIFIINLNFVLSGYSRTEHLGVRLLKYLRLRGLNNHCVVYSFLTREQLLEMEPKNLILFSEGISYYRLPFDVSSIPFQNLFHLKSPEDLSPYFKAEFSLPDNRHFMANWWGVLQLWKVQKAVERINGKSNLEKIEPLFNHALKEMNSYEGLVACHIKKTGELQIDRGLNRLLKEKDENYQNEERTRGELQIENAQLNEEIGNLDVQLESLRELESETPDTFWTKVLKLRGELPNQIRLKIERLNEKKEQLEKLAIRHKEYLNLTKLINREKELIYEKQRLAIRRINRNIAEMENSLSFSSPQFSLHEIREKLKKANPRIVFVDDQAEEGWSSVLQRIIYGNESENFITIIPRNVDTTDQIAIQIRDTVKKHRADLLILDLRLKGETGSITDPEQISGVQVLEKLHESRIGCPVLVTTASNKMWSYKKTIHTGALAFWVKEGLDESYKTENTIENYLRFVDLVYTLCFSNEIKFLYRELLPGILDIENSETVYWWESKFWDGQTLKTPKSLAASKTEITEVLFLAFEQFEEYLKLKLQQTIKPELSKSIASLIIVQCTRVLEIIHRIDESKKDSSLSVKMAEQLGKEKYDYWSKLITIRNKAAHQFIADYRKVENFLELLLAYLNDEYIEAHEKLEKTLHQPINGAVYESVIESKHRDFERYYLKNPELDLDGWSSIILDLNFNRNIDKISLSVGDRVRFTLKIIEKSETTYYYANNATLIESVK